VAVAAPLVLLGVDALDKGVRRRQLGQPKSG
jgi:hypothetical protein